MQTQRKKELLAAYKERRPDMGVISYHCIPTEERFLEITRDAKATFNRHGFQLKMGMHANQTLQTRWNTYGEAQIAQTLLKKLKYKNKEDVTAEALKKLLETCLAEDPQAQRLLKKSKAV